MSKFLTNIDLTGNELQNVVIHNTGTAPTASAKLGGLFFDTSGGVNKLKYYNGSAWVELSSGGSGTWQPADADLAAIAALTGTAGFLKTNGSSTWSVDTATYLTSGTGVTTVNGASGAITNVALTTGTLAQFAATTSAQLAGVVSDETGTGALVFANTPTFVSPILGTVGTGSILTNATGLPINGGVSGLGTGVATFLATPTTANLLATVVGSTGLGNLVFALSPSISTSLTTSTASFNLLNTTATTIYFAGAATALSIGAATGTTTINNNTVVTGNLTVNGTTTTVNSTVVTVDDILIELGAVASPTDITAEGGGISLLGLTNKTLTWVGTNTAWTSSENFNIVTGKTYKINGTDVLSSTTLGSTVIGSSLTSVGILNGGTWNASTIAVLYGGTGATTAAGAKTNLGFTTKYAADIGNGTATSITVTHGLTSSDVQVYVYEKASPFGQVFADVAHTSSSVVTLAFAVAPTSAQYRVVVIG